MPIPNANESERDYVARCVPQLIGEGKKPDQAIAICHAMYDEHKKPAVSASVGYVLNLSGANDSSPLPLGLEGYPATDSAGQPIHYRRMKIAQVGKWTHRGTGEEFEITRDRADQWARNHQALSAVGVRPFVPGEHRATFNAADNHGYVARVEREGDDVFAVVALHGDDALKLAAKNGRSIYVVNDAKDAQGNVHKGESLHHLALVPNPALPDLGDAVRIAASADRPALSVPVFTLAAATPTQKESEMNKELAKKFREKLGVAADVPDEKLPDLAAEKALALSADVATLTTERDTLKTNLTAKTTEVLALSANDKEPDALSMSLITRSFKTDRDRVVESGVISEAGMKELDALLLPSGKPGKFALALSGGSPDPLYSRVCDILRRNPGVKTDNAIPRDVASRAEAHEQIANGVALTLSGDVSQLKAEQRDRQAELLREQLGQNKKSA
jgi:hypothetical protein